MKKMRMADEGEQAKMAALVRDINEVLERHRDMGAELAVNTLVHVMADLTVVNHLDHMAICKAYVVLTVLGSVSDGMSEEPRTERH